MPTPASLSRNGLLALLVCSLAFAAIIARADTGPNAHEDSQSMRDRAAYKSEGIERRFGVPFNPHAEVCGGGTDQVHCTARVITDAKGAPNAAPRPISGLSPLQMRTAYGLSGLATGHPVIAIVDAYDHPNIASDLAAYSSNFGLPQLPACSGAISASSVACFKKVNQTGNASPLPRSNAGWALEIALDVEVAHAICTNCSILLVEANSASYGDLMAAVDRAVTLGAKVVSNSYGSNEFAGETAYDTHFNHPGVAFVFSSGDSGYGVEYPAASQYVTAVGGTSLFLNSNNTYRQELTWNGAGSGCSAYEAKPLWQTDSGCVRRTVADVSAVADPNTGAAVYDSVKYNNKSGWFKVGGTSLAAPLIAATFAQGGVPGATAENSLPYLADASTTLRDIVSGANGACTTPYLCTALAGYDGPTGLGSPKGAGAF